MVGVTQLRMPRNLSALLMYVGDQVARGYYFHMSGRVSISKSENLIAKMEERYETNSTSSKRVYRKSRGIPTFMLVAFKYVDEEELYWLLLGAGNKEKIEKYAAQFNDYFLDANEKNFRLEIRDYVLKRTTRSSENGGGKKYSWYLTKKSFKYHLAEMVSAARSNHSSDRLEIVAARLRNRPQFAGVRQQTSEIFHTASFEYIKTNGKRAVLPNVITKTLPFFSKKIRIFD